MDHPFGTENCATFNEKIALGPQLFSLKKKVSINVAFSR